MSSRVTAPGKTKNHDFTQFFFVVCLLSTSPQEREREKPVLEGSVSKSAKAHSKI